MHPVELPAVAWMPSIGGAGVDRHHHPGPGASWSIHRLTVNGWPVSGGTAGAHLPARGSQRHYGPELVYCKEIRPVVDNGATVMDRILGRADVVRQIDTRGTMRRQNGLATQLVASL